MVPTVERGLRLVVFCSMEMAGLKSFDRVHIGALDLVQELARVGGKRLHVTPLAFGVDGVEGQRRLAGAGESGDDGELVARNSDMDVAQVMLARATHGDVGNCHSGNVRRFREREHAAPARRRISTAAQVRIESLNPLCILFGNRKGGQSMPTFCDNGIVLKRSK